MQRLRAAVVYVEHLEFEFISSIWKPLQIWAESQCLWQLRAPYHVNNLLTPVDIVGCILALVE